jgi:hypothetical protein
MDPNKSRECVVPEKTPQAAKALLPHNMANILILHEKQHQNGQNPAQSFMMPLTVKS